MNYVKQAYKVVPAKNHHKYKKQEFRKKNSKKLF